MRGVGIDPAVRCLFRDEEPMQIESFKILRDLVETTSFSQAAERNGMTQSAVSQHIKVLEEAGLLSKTNPAVSRQVGVLRS